MSSPRHQRITREHPNSNRISNASSESSYRPSLNASNIHIDVKEWLNKAKLSDYHSTFCREGITIEELLSFTDIELLSVAEETLHLNVLHRKRFISAMNRTKQQMNIEAVRGHVYSRSSSNLLANIVTNDSSVSSLSRPISPSLSIHSTHSSPMDSNRKYSTNKYQFMFNDLNHNHTDTQQSPLITTKYNNHNYYHHRRPSAPAAVTAHILPSIPSKSVPKINGSPNIELPTVKPRAKSHRFRDRRHSTPETEDNINENNKSGALSFHGSTTNSASSESSEYLIDHGPHSAQSAYSMPPLISKQAAKKRRINRKLTKKKKKFKKKYERDKLRKNKKLNSIQMNARDRSNTYDTIPRQFKITRSSSKQNMSQSSATPILTAIHSHDSNRKRTRSILSDNDLTTIDSNPIQTLAIQRMRLNSSQDEDEDELIMMSSDSHSDGRHSEDEKWHELEHRNGADAVSISKEEKEDMKSINVLLRENNADRNQIEQGLKLLNHHYMECETQIAQYFDELEQKLKERNSEIMNVLNTVKSEKEKILNMKIMKLEQEQKHVLRQKYLCDQLFKDNDGNNIQQRKKKIAQLRDIALMNHNNKVNDNNDSMCSERELLQDEEYHNMHELSEMDSLIETQFDTQRRDAFYDHICVVKECVVPHPPYITARARDDNCVSLKIHTMTSKEKKAIQYDPHSNHSKNSRIQQIQIEYIQCKTTNIQHIYAAFETLNTEKREDDNVAVTKSSQKSSRKVKRKKKRKKTKHNEYEEEQKDEEEMHTNETLDDKKGTELLIIDASSKLKRIHEVIIDNILPVYYCYIRARTNNINGWSAFCEPIDAGLLPIDRNALKFDLENSSHSSGIIYESQDSCVVFEHIKEHHIAVIDCVIDKKEYNIFEWKYIVDFRCDDVEEKHEDNKKTKHKKRNKNERKLIKQKYMEMDLSDLDYHKIEGICMGFIAYPLEKCMKYNNATLGRSGTQYGLCVASGRNSAHAFYTRNSNTHHTCAIKLQKRVENGDEFRVLCNMKKEQCDVYHNGQIIVDVFGTKIPNKIMPAVSGCMNNGVAACTVQFISSRSVNK